MGTPEHRRAANRSGLRYPSDVSDGEWAIAAPMIPPARHGGRKRSVNVREVLNGIFYVLLTRCQWKALPKDLPPRSTVHDYEVYVTVREQDGREPSPTAAIIDSRTANGAQKGGLRSIDAGKKINGHLRHILVDTLGLLLNVVVHPADVQARDGAFHLLRRARRLFPFIERRDGVRLDQPPSPLDPRFRTLEHNRRCVHSPRHDPPYAQATCCKPLVMNPNFPDGLSDVLIAKRVLQEVLDRDLFTTAQGIRMYSNPQKLSQSGVLELRQQAGRWLKHLREARGLSQRNLADRVGADYYTFISQLEAGRGRIPPDRYIAWAKALGVEPKIFVQTLMRYYDPVTYAIIFEG